MMGGWIVRVLRLSIKLSLAGIQAERYLTKCCFPSFRLGHYESDKDPVADDDDEGDCEEEGEGEPVNGLQRLELPGGRHHHLPW